VLRNDAELRYFSGEGMTVPQAALPDYQGSGGKNIRSLKRRWSLAEILCWLLLVVLCSVGVADAVVAHDARESAGSDPTLNFLGKYAVGVHEINRGGGFGGATAETELIKAVDKAAKSPQDRLRAAIVAGELQGRETALKRLDVLEQEDAGIAQDVQTARDLISGDAQPEGQPGEFQQRYGWFAKLAQSIERPAGDPVRAGVLHSAMFVLVAYIATIVALLGIVVIGLVLLVIGIVLLASKRLKLRFSPSLPPGDSIADRRTYLYGFVIYLGSIITLNLAIVLVSSMHVADSMVSVIRVAALGVFVLAFVAGLLFPLFRGQSAAEWRAALGLHLGRGFFREVGGGIVGYIAGLPALAAGVLLTALLVNLSGYKPSHPLEETLDKSVPILVLAFALASVWAPITEELMFRGALFAHLRERFGWWISAPVVALVFAIIHPQGWVALPVLGSIALVLAGIREWRGSIIGCMTAHALHNTTALVIAVLMLRG
jgi:membrane protease YdiL (CAAX protease family)